MNQIVIKRYKTVYACSLIVLVISGFLFFSPRIIKAQLSGSESFRTEGTLPANPALRSDGVSVGSNSTDATVQASPTHLGPPGGIVLALVPDPGNVGTIYAGTQNSGIYKSTDDGQSWNQINNGLTSTIVNTIVIDAANSGHLFAGTSAGVFKTVDAGANWVAVNNGLPSFPPGTSFQVNVQFLVINPVDPSTLYAAINGGTGGGEYGLFKTVDGGATWTLTESVFATGLAISASAPGTLYVGATNTGEIFSTTDGGLNWVKKKSPGVGEHFNCMLIDPTNPNTVYIGSDGQITKSTDGGNTWQFIPVLDGASVSTVQRSVYTLFATPGSPNTLWAGTGTGVIRSLDGGAHWQDFNNGFPFPLSTTKNYFTLPTTNALAINPASLNEIYAGTEFGVFKSGVNSAQWTFTNNGLNNSNVTGVVFDPSNSLTMYAITDLGIRKSSDGGATWTDANSGLPTGKPGQFDSPFYVTSLAVNPQNSNVLYAGLGWLGGSGVYKSVNGGASWSKSNLGIEQASISNIVFDPSNSNIIYAAETSGIDKSMDAGATWTRLLSFRTASLTIDPKNPNTLYAATGSVLRSVDGGANWSLLFDSHSSQDIRMIAIDPVTSNTIYAANGVYGFVRSLDGGTTWIQSSIGFQSFVYQVVINPATPSVLYAATSQGLFKGTANGRKWTQLDLGLTNAGINVVALKPGSSDFIYAGTNGSGILGVQQPPDTIKPAVTLTTPVNGAVTRLRQITVQGSVTDDAGGSGIASIKVNGNEAIYDGTHDTFSATLTIPAEGPFNITAQAVDGAGNVSNTASAVVTLDQTRPAITIDSPANGATVNGSSVIVTGTISDATTSVTSLKVNGQPATITGNSYTAVLNVPCSRPVTIVATATDQAGNTVTATRAISVNVPPTTLPCWTGNGLDGGSVNVITVDPSNSANVFAATNRGIFKSTDGGATWHSASAGLLEPIITTLTIDPGNPSTVYAASLQSNVYKSTDGGATWNFLPTGLSVQSSNGGIAIDPTNSANLYTGSNAQGIIRSVDGGLDWANVGSTSSLIGLRTLVIDPNAPATLYAGVPNAGVYKTVDAGLTWKNQSTGLTSMAVTQIVIDPTNSNTLYSVTPSGIFKTTDGAVTWSAVNNGLSNLGITALAIDAKNPNTLYSASSSGLARTTDGGGHWSSVNLGIPSSLIQTITVDRANSNTIYLGTTAGIIKTTDGGTNWTNSNVGLKAAEILSLAVDPVANNIVYAGSAVGVYLSSDNGNTLSLAANGPIGRIFQIVVSPFDHKTVFAATEIGLYKSTDSGANWVQLSGAGPQTISIALDPVNSNLIYAGAPFALMKTFNGGDSWIQINNGSLPGLPVRSIVIDQSVPSRIYLGTVVGVFRSSNSGSSWVKTTNSLPADSNTPAIALDPSHSGTIYQGTQGFGLYKSIDNGVTWTLVGNGLPADSYIQGLAVDTGNTNNIYASTYTGLYKSTDSGTTWNPITTYLDFPFSGTVAIDPVNTGTIYNAPAGLLRLSQPAPPLITPNLFRLSKTSAPAGTGDTAIQVSGVNFAQGSTVQWNGSDRATSYINSTTLMATITAANLAVSGIGVVTVNNPGAGASNAINFTVGAGLPTATLQLANLNQVYDGTPRSVVVTTNPTGLTGVSVTYDGSTTQPTNVGSYPIVASLNNPNFQASNVTGTLVISRADQTITFAAITDKVVYDNPFQLAAVATSGLPVSYQTTGGINISGNTVTIVGTGSATITASQAGSNNYNAAQSVSRTFNINNPLPQILRLNPGAIIAGSGQTTLKVAGSNFVTDSLVKIDGVNSPATFVNRIEMDIPLSATDLASPGTKTITITNLAPGGGNSIPVTLKIISITSSDSRNIQPGTTDTVSNAPTQSGDAGITAQLNHSQSAGGPATVTVQQYSADPFGGSGLIDVGGGYVDLKVTGADPNDTLNATFYYGSNVTGANEDKLQLLYFTGTKWAKVRNSGNTDPIKNTMDNQDGTVSGGTFNVVFDETSSPKLSQLTGTIFSSTTGLYGDLNDDQVINVVDLILIANFLAGNTTVDKTAADLNQDAKVNVTDLITLANYLAGNIGHLPVGNAPTASNPSDPISFGYGLVGPRSIVESWFRIPLGRPKRSDFSTAGTT